MGWLNQSRNLPMLRQLGGSAEAPPEVAPVLSAPGTTEGTFDLDWTASSGFTFDEYRIYSGLTELGVYSLLDTVVSAVLTYETTISVDTWFYIAPYNSGTATESNESNRAFVGYTPPAPPDSYYMRPDGVSFYLRPDGVSKYQRP